MKNTLLTLKQTGACFADFGVTVFTLLALNALFFIGAATIVTDILDG